MFKRFAAIASVALLPLAAGAATLIIPAAGTGPGANGSQWSTELVFHNASSQEVDFDLKFHDSTGTSKTKSFFVQPRLTNTTPDVVRNIFGLTSGTGAIEIDVDDAQLSRFVVTSRTFNTAPDGAMFGQDIPAVNANDAAGAGDLTVLEGPSFASDFRFNFGAYALTDATIRWQVIRADGTEGATKDVDYKGGTQFQYNNGISTLLGATPQDFDVVYATVLKGKAIIYGSGVNNKSGDPTYVPGLRARADTKIAFGVDVNEDGTVDLKDADQNGVLDSPVPLFTIGFPNFFRVVVLNAKPGSNVKIELADNSTPDVLLVDDKGTIEWAPSSTLRGQDIVLKVKITVDGTSEIVSIPAHVQ